MTTKRDICEEIGSYYGTFYEDISGLLVIDNGDEEFTYNTENELLQDWLPTLEESDRETGDDYWADIIEYIRDVIL